MNFQESPTSTIFYLSIFTSLIVLLFEFHHITRRPPPFKYYRITVMFFTAIFCAYYLLSAGNKYPCYIFNHTKPVLYVIAAVFVFYIPQILEDVNNIYKRVKRQKFRKPIQFLLTLLRNEYYNGLLTQILIYPAIEAVIFYAYYDNMLLRHYSPIATVFISSTFYGYSKIYYFTTSPASLASNKWPIIKRTAIYMIQSFIFAIAINFAWILSHSFITATAIGSFVNYIDFPNTIVLWEKHSNSIIQIFIRFSIVFSYIFIFGVVMMFATADDYTKL